MMKKEKIKYLLKSTFNYFKPKKCPYCGGDNVLVIDRKFLITRLLECNVCKLMFRHPKDSINHSLNFYNESYKQEGLTTDLPDKKSLQELKDTKFKNSLRSTSTAESIFKLLNGDITNCSILDYGCSWGYTVWQFKKAGMLAKGFEISKIRSKFGIENLDVEILNELNDLNNEKFDFLYSSHVIEHLPDLNHFANLCIEKVKNEGFIVLLCPNASMDFKQKNPDNFHLFWGKVHPNMISDKFLLNIFCKFPLYISSNPYDLSKISNWDQKSQILDLNGGNELLCIIKNTKLKKSA